MAAAAGDESHHLRAALREAFGDSSDSESDAPWGSAPLAGAGAGAWPAGSGGGGMRWRRSGVCGSALTSSPPTSKGGSSLRSKEKDGSAMCTINAATNAELTNEDEDSCPLPSDLLRQLVMRFSQAELGGFEPTKGSCPPQTTLTCSH
ncbi:hypothetical protein EJB05_26151, partial [Eragrostis curvula]